ncbi:unnamed protein product, partial [Allacma fusca]
MDEVPDIEAAHEISTANSSTLSPASTDNSVQSSNQDDSIEAIARLEAKIEKLKSAKKGYKQKLEEQRELIEELQRKMKSSLSRKKKVELLEGSGVYLRASKVAAAKLASRTPSILATNLFRFVFSSDEMIGRSLM